MPGASSTVISAFVSWAHAHEAWRPEKIANWRQTVLDLATALRSIGGIDADLDLWHLTTHENWSTFGPTAIHNSDFTLIAVSRAYRERWEETGSSQMGAGSAREANVLKAMFDQDRAEFRRRVKVVLLPGSTVSDIPAELLSSTERFEVPSADLVGLLTLLRSLHGRPEFVKPPIGFVPDLPPSYLGSITAEVATGAEDADPVPAGAAVLLRQRLSAIDGQLGLSDGSELDPYEREQLEDERSIAAGSLQSLERTLGATSVPQRDLPDREDPVSRAVADAEQSIAAARSAMAAIPDIAREAIFQYFHGAQPMTVGGELDSFTIGDAIRAEEHGSVSWVEDVEQTVSAREANPRVGAAIHALRRLRSVVFDGVPYEPRADAPPWAEEFLRLTYEIEDAQFELRPVWVALGLLR